MAPDLLLTIGFAAGFLAVPVIINALREGVGRWFAAFLTLVSGGFVSAAFLGKPGGYMLEEIPGVLFTVITRFF